MSQDARRHYEAIQRAVRGADGVMGKAGDDVLKAWDRIAKGDTPVTEAQRIQFMRDLETIIHATFVSHAAYIENSPLYQVITRESERIFVATMKAGLDDLDDIMKPYPWWNDAKKYWRNAPLSAIERDDIAMAYRMLYGPHVDRQRILNARLFDPQRIWVDSKEYRLSDSIWKQGQAYRGAIDRTIQRGIQQGWSADKIARELRQFVDPAYAPVKYTKSGRVYRTGSTYRPNAASAARRLARTEITRVHGESTKERVRSVPGAFIRWRLSLQHPKHDICDEHATADLFDLGDGCYPVDDVPEYPPHPNCMCTLLPAQKSRDEVRDEIVNRYRAAAFADVGFSPETGWAS